MTKILVAVPFGLGIFIALALLPGYQGYAAALVSYGGMMLALMGWTPMPMIAKVRAGEGASILASIKALPTKIPFLNRGETEEEDDTPDLVALDDVDSMLADLASAAEDDAPAPSAGLGDIVDAPADAEPEPVAVAAVVEPTPSRFPLVAKLLAIPMAYLAKLRPHRESADEPVDPDPADLADADVAPGLLAKVMAFVRPLLAKFVSREPDAEEDAAEMAAEEATALAVDAGEVEVDAEPTPPSLVGRVLALFKLALSKITVKSTDDDADEADEADPADAALALAVGEADDIDIDVEPATHGLLSKVIAFARPLLAKFVSRESADDADDDLELELVEPTPSKTLRQRVVAIRALLPADLSVAGLKRSTIATATRLIERA